jgi:NAD(P)-dependent dehydrogenase (short-subunit alcohol dehydrogenase family)
VKIAAIENAQYGITVNSIQLGYTGIGMGKLTDEAYEKAKNKSAMKRFCTMWELYKTIDYIIETEYLTGQNIRLDGGIR